MRKETSFSMYNRHSYLNNQIKIFYDLVSKTINKFRVDVKVLKTQLKDLNLWSETKKKLKPENKQINEKFEKKFKMEMCPNIKNGKKCEEGYRKCKFAHSAIQLNLVRSDSRSKMIKKTIQETQGKILNTKTPVAWNYPKEGVYEKGRNFEKILIEKNCDFKNKRCKSEKKERSVDIHRLRIKSHEI